MRRRTPLAFAGFVVVVLGGVIGFASFAAEPPPTPAATAAADIHLPDSVSGRLTAAILSSRLSFTPPRADTVPPTTPAPHEPAEDAAAVSDVPEITTPAAAAPTTTEAIAPAPTTTSTPTTRAQSPTIPITQPPITFLASVERWRPLVATYFPPSLLDQALSVMQCESRGDPNADNPNSTAAGLFQFIASTWNWASANAGFTGVTVYDPEANIATAAFVVEYSLDRDLPAWQHWVCQPDLSS